MRKSNLTDGTPMLVMKIDQFVTLRVFAQALTDFYVSAFNSDSKTIIDFDKLWKTQAIDILKHQLRKFGRDGDYKDGFFEACEADEGKFYNGVYALATEWVLKHYPYLKK